MLIEAVRADITVEHVDAIVNAANSTLLGGGGVDGAIHAAAGPALLVACREIRLTSLPGGLPTGEAVATGGGNLPARWVIHTVGPVAHEHADGGAALLARAHKRCLEVANALGVESIAFPAISCGAYGWRAEDAAPIAVGAVLDFATAHPDSSIRLVRFALFTEHVREPFAAAVTSVVE